MRSLQRKRPMSHKQKTDLLSRLPTEVELLESRQQIARVDCNIATIREMAENRMGSARYSQEHAPGPYQVDVHVDTSGIEEWLEEASEASSAVQDRLESIEGELAWRMDAAMEQAAQSHHVLKEIAVDSRRTQENTRIMSGELTQLKTISGLHLGIATTGLAMQRSANKTLEAIHESLEEGLEEIVDSLEDIEETLDDGFTSLEQAVVQSGTAIASRLDSVLAGQRWQAEVLGIAIARSSAFVASFIQKSVAALDRAQQARHAELIATMREPLSIEAEQKYQDALVNFGIRNMGVALRDLEEMFKRKSTHVLGWILFGQVSFACGRSREAKDAYALAAQYAWPNRREAPHQARAYNEALSRLAGLEYLQGNYADALAVLEKGIEKWQWWIADDLLNLELSDDLRMEWIRMLLRPEDPGKLRAQSLTPKRLTAQVKQFIRADDDFWSRVKTRGFWKEATTSPLFKPYAKQLAALNCGPFTKKVQGKRKRVISTPPPTPPHAPPPRVINYLQPIALEAEPFYEKMVRQIEEMADKEVIERFITRLWYGLGGSEFILQRHSYWQADLPYPQGQVGKLPEGYPASWGACCNQIHWLIEELQGVPKSIKERKERRIGILCRLESEVQQLYEWVDPQHQHSRDGGALTPNLAKLVELRDTVRRLLAELDL